VTRRTVTELGGKTSRELVLSPLTSFVTGAIVSGAASVLRADGSRVSTASVRVESMRLTPVNDSLAVCCSDVGMTSLT
jgi:hypothetical protein